MSARIGINTSLFATVLTLTLSLAACNKIDGSSGSSGIAIQKAVGVNVSAADGSCQIDGQTLAAGESVTRYFAATSFACTAEVRTCANGVLSGAATFSSCAVQPKSGPQIGILFSLWHCPFSSSPTANASFPIYDISQILAGIGTFGPIGTPHWWGKPDNGYYCLTENDAILTQHAQMLADAGIDFIYIDGTNWDTQAAGTSMIVQPLNELLRVWSTIPGAPKVVPWFAMKPGADILNYYDQALTNYPQMTFNYQGKPLMLAVGYSSTDDVIGSLLPRYTVKKMWGELTTAQLNTGEWSFLQGCQAGFKANYGASDCNQLAGVNNPEQVSVSTSVQQPVMSDSTTAIPKFNGLTFLKQLQTARQYPSAKIVTITGWNEWIAGRFCADYTLNCAGTGGGDLLPNGNRVFIDQYDHEYSRDMEPGGGQGAFYFNLLKSSLQLFRAGQDPISALSSVSSVSAWSHVPADTGAAGTQPIYRSYFAPSGDQLFSISPDEGPIAGYQSVGSLFSLASTASPLRVALYRCLGPQNHFVSQDPHCEGAHTDYLLGYAGIVPSMAAPWPLFRCDVDGSGLKLVTTNQSECLGGASGYHTVAMIGYVAIEGQPALPTSSVVPAPVVSAPQPEGFFQVNQAGGIFYSNGTDAYCSFSSFAKFVKAGGKRNLSNVAEIANLPVGMQNDGSCN